MMEFNKEFKERTAWAEKVVKEFLPEETTKQKLVMEAMNYSVNAGGKRLRPLLMCETAKMFGGDTENVKPFMAAIEYIHTYSLVHDDLPAMDNDDYRRGRKTTHKEYGEGMGVLAGDALLNYAFETAIDGVLKSDNPARAAAALSVIAHKAGIYGMIGGQTVDIMSEGKPQTKDSLDYINELKTGALIEASMMAGAILAGATQSEVDVIEKVALNIGLAFQIKDDILDVTGDEEEIGKPVHSDEKNNKSTYVNIMGIDDAAKEVKRLSTEAEECLKSLGKEDEFLLMLIDWLTSRKK